MRLAPLLVLAALTLEPARSDELASLLKRPLTLQIRGASLPAVLEQIAVLLDVTPILEPGLDGAPVTLDLRGTTIEKALSLVQASAGVTIRFANGRMLVAGRPGADRGGAPSPLPSRLASERPAPAVPYLVPVPRTEGSAAERYLLEDGDVALPGCEAAVRVASLSGDPFDGRTRVAFHELAAPFRSRAARIAAASPADAPATETLWLGGCSRGFQLRSFAPGGAPSSTVPLAAARPPRERVPWLVRMRLLEVDAAGEAVLSAPTVAAPANLLASIRSRSDLPRHDGPPLATDTSISLAVLDSTETEALLALNLTMTRDEPSPFGERTVRVAHQEQSLWLRLGEPARSTVSSTYGKGRSALVIETTVEKREPRKP